MSSSTLTSVSRVPLTSSMNPLPRASRAALTQISSASLASASTSTTTLGPNRSKGGFAGLTSTLATFPPASSTNRVASAAISPHRIGLTPWRGAQGAGNLSSGYLAARPLRTPSARRASPSVAQGFLSKRISNPSSAVNSGKRSLYSQNIASVAASSSARWSIPRTSRAYAAARSVTSTRAGRASA
jgi:hypothetical protein